MCDFISWIKTTDKDRKPLYLWLQDKDVFSSHGRKTLRGTRHNDVIGHGAIRLYYGLDVGVGEECEERDFWHRDTQRYIPEEIVRTFKTPEAFFIHYGRMLRAGAFQGDDLRHIISYAPRAFKDIAWEQYLKQKGDLWEIVDGGDYEKRYLRSAATELLKRKLSVDDLCRLSEILTIAETKPAWEKVFSRSLSFNDLYQIKENAPPVYQKRVWRHPDE